ncbi:hypothetical protein FACS189423_10350 [Bacteroidia bacterium]|nr:hypothetical protein FACS189423_10350 [Bacteroidia bacterium]
MKMKKMIFLMLTLLIWGAASMNAQVNIGSEDGPKAGAVLDLSQGTKHLGLILPNVSLANVSEWQLDEGASKTSTSYPEAAGTVVFNTNADLKDAGNQTLGKGIFVWNGNGWQAAKSGAGGALALDFTLLPNSSVDIYEGSTRSFTASSIEPSSAAQGVKWAIPAGGASIAAIQGGYTTLTCTVEGLTEGQTTLTVTSLDGNVSKDVTINVLPVTLKTFTLTPTALTLIKGAGAGTVTASDFLDTNDQSLSGVTVTWSKKDGTDPTGSTLTPAGNKVDVTPGATAGQFTLVASAAGIDKESTVSVKDPDAIAGPDANYKPSLQGITCFDVRPDKDDPAAEPRVYTVVEGGTTSTIASVAWGVTPSSAGLLNAYVPGATNTNTLNFKDLATLQSVANPTAQTIELVALVTYANGQERKVSATVKIQYKACCPTDAGGYIRENGVYTGPSSVASGLNLASTLDLYTNVSNTNLCVGPDLGNSLTWNTVSAASWCNDNVHAKGGDWDDGNNDWRLPNIGELANLQAVKGDIPSLSTSNNYWSSTDYSANPTVSAALWYFNGSGSTYGSSKTNSATNVYTRCVRTMN